METFEKICIELIQECREYAQNQNWEDMLEFLDEKENQVEECQKMPSNARKIC